MKANHNPISVRLALSCVGLNISNSKNESKSQQFAIFLRRPYCWVKYQ
ncbi:hypothetical protein GO621_09410 [Mucilaginibacter sp. HMF7410]|uniref:Uncharacterized protein n=1 Tax=Mucilaginibacter arboris TaxID=2682090 RepID=A0A7K1SWT3_9SPHI|nr:hypothetical protein [Mucilaginibacter arboris]MVN21753.1 hypothetical protein [Mucilaginibacter arboris]